MNDSPALAHTSEIGITPKGIPYALVDGRQLHSTMAPQREAERMVAAPEIRDAELVLVFGAGLGYILEALFEQKPGVQVIVLEPWEEFARKALDARPLKLFPHPARPLDKHGSNQESLHFIYSWEPNVLVSLLQDAGARKPALIANPALKAAFPQEFQSCQEGLALFLKRSQVNSNTLKRFGTLWVRNFARNRPHLSRARGISELEGSCRGMPGLVLAGGPGLDEVLPFLPALRERFVLIAVDTSLRACLRAGVDPDFVVTVDPQYWNARHLDWTAGSRARIVTESSIYPSSLRRRESELFLCSSFFPLARWYEEQLGKDFGKLGAGGSVATSAWDLLRVLGCSESWIAGLDLSCPGGKTHFHGALFEEQTHGSSTRFRPAESGRFNYLYNDAAYAIGLEDGSEVMTDRRMDMYAQWFENQSALYPQRIQKRTGQGNRPIKGLERSTLEAMLDLPRLRCPSDQFIPAVTAQDPCQCGEAENPPGPFQELLAQANQSLLDLLQDLCRSAHEALECTRSLKALVDAGETDPVRLRPLLERLDCIDAKLMNNPDARIPGFLMEGEIQNILQQGASSDHGLSSSLRLYEALERTTLFHLNLFQG